MKYSKAFYEWIGRRIKIGKASVWKQVRKGSSLICNQTLYMCLVVQVGFKDLPWKTRMDIMQHLHVATARKGMDRLKESEVKLCPERHMHMALPQNPTALKLDALCCQWKVKRYSETGMLLFFVISASKYLFEREITH